MLFLCVVVDYLDGIRCFLEALPSLAFDSWQFLYHLFFGVLPSQGKCKIEHILQYIIILYVLLPNLFPSGFAKLVQHALLIKLGKSAILVVQLLLHIKGNSVIGRERIQCRLQFILHCIIKIIIKWDIYKRKEKYNTYTQSYHYTMDLTLNTLDLPLNYYSLSYPTLTLPIISDVIILLKEFLFSSRRDALMD